MSSASNHEAHDYAERIRKRLPRKLQELREACGLSKYALWQMTSVSRDMIGRIEGGESIPTLHLSARKGRTTGTFISYKDDRLLMLGKDLGPAYTKKYGNQLHMNKFADDVPVYESIDVGDFEFVGNPAKVLPKVKEGAIITIHGAGDDNITRIELGVPKKE